MCACKQKRASFLIEDILCETRSYKHLRLEPLESNTCSKIPEEDLLPNLESPNRDVSSTNAPKGTIEDSPSKRLFDSKTSQETRSREGLKTEDVCKFSISKLTSADFGKSSTSKHTSTTDFKRNEDLTRFNVQRELEMSLKANLEHRRNTLPLYPTPIKPNALWPPYRLKSPTYPVDGRSMGFYSDPAMKSEQILRNQLAANRFMSNPYSLRQVYGFDRG